MQATQRPHNRTQWPPIVPCRRPYGIVPGECVGHADCRADYWRRHDAKFARVAVRGEPSAPKSRVRA